ncbi:HD domain-containing protein [Candidatus Shapirobacteria bacterium]|nr:HD domain-containing protein [Candidatus Shapirobacteria bacterium]
MSEKLTLRAEKGKTVCGLIITSDKMARAYELGVRLFKDKKRASGEPYYHHCLEVARILQQEWGITNEDVIIAALHHDTGEDTNYPIDKLRTGYGDTVADLIVGVTNLPNSTDGESVKKVLGEDSTNLGVAVIKLADRLHNMRTLDAMPEAKRVKKADETMSVYTRLAASIGLWKAKTELEDLSFKYLDPVKYEEFKSKIDSDPRRQSMFIDHVTSRLHHSLQGIKILRIVPEPGGYWASYDQMQKRAQRGESLPEDVTEIEDITRFIVVTDSIDSMYQACGRVRQEFNGAINFNRSHEYLNQSARENGYQAIETAIRSTEGDFNVAVVTPGMDSFNHYGVVGLINSGEYQDKKHNLIYVFTASGHVRYFKVGATGVDFAASINNSVLADANSITTDGVPTSLSTTLRNGTNLYVVTGESRSAPLPGVENYCRFPETRLKIRQLRTQEKRLEKIATGKNMLEPLISQLGIFDLADLGHDPILKSVLYKLECEDLSGLYFKMASQPSFIHTVSQELFLGGITKEKLGLVTIRLRGKDHRGILKKLMDEVEKTGVNIYNTGHVKSKESFELRVLLQHLSKNKTRSFHRRVLKQFVDDKLEIDITL